MTKNDMQQNNEHGPWEDYAQTSSQVEHGPWEDYAQTSSQVEHGPWEYYQDKPGKPFHRYSLSAADKKRVLNSFSGDPLAFIADAEEKSFIQRITEDLSDRDEYRKRMALAAYFTAENQDYDFTFNINNLDSILEKFYKKKTTVDEAYSDFQKMYGVERSSTLKELPGVFKEDLAALGAGAVEFASTAAATYLKLAKWGSDLQATILSPLMSEEQKKFAFGYGKVLEDVGQKHVIEGNREIIKNLDEESGANPEFITDLFTGDWENVSPRDFTKALARSVPGMSFQIMAAAAAPWVLPAIVGTETIAMKDYEVEEKHPEWNGTKKWSYIGLSAANEALFEIVTSKIVGGKMTKEAGAKLIQQGLLKYMGKSFAKEGSSEAAQQMLSNINDLLFDVEGDRDTLNGMQLMSRVFDQVGEAGFIGGVWGFPEGVAGYRSAREVVGIVNNVKQKHEKRIAELREKEVLSLEEQKQIEVSKKIIHSANPQELIALDHINDTLEKEADAEKITASEEFKSVEQSAAAEATQEEKIAAVRAERANNFDTTSSWNIEDVADVVSEYSKTFKDTVFHVVEDWKSVLDNPDIDARKRAAYNIKTGEVYINAARVRPHEVAEVMLHEVVGHKGIREVLKGETFNSILDQVYRDHFNEQEFKSIAARYFKPVELTDDDGLTYLDISLDKIDDQRLAAEEYIAHIAETRVKPNWWKEFIQKIRMAFANVLGKEFRMSDDQIEILLARSSRKMKRSRFGGETSVVKKYLTTDKKNLDVADGDGLRYTADGVLPGIATRFLYEGKKEIPIADGFVFDKTEDMQKAMLDYISLLNGEHFTIKEDNTEVYFDKTSATEYALSKNTKSLRNRKSKLFKAKAKAVAAIGSIVRNAQNGQDENIKEGHSKYGKKGVFRRYDVEFGIPSGNEDIKVFTGKLVVWCPKNGKCSFYDITNINFSRKVREIANATDSTEPRLKDGVVLHQPPADGINISQTAENATQDGFRFSVGDGANNSALENLPYYDIPFADSVDNVLNKKTIGHGLIFVRNTPEALQKVGIPALPIMMTQEHIRDIYNDYAPAGRNAHGLGEQLKSLPQMLEKPVAVIATNKNDSVVVITQYEDKSGNDIMVPIIIGAETTAQGQIRITANIAASVYGKQSVSDMLEAAIEKEKSGEIAIFGANKKIASKLSLRGLQLTRWSGFEAVHNITDKNSPVKLDVNKNTKSLQFKRWFGDSIVVDENGEPMVVYHGSSADFTVFDHRFGFRNGAADGRGFYFTSDQSKAEGYKTENGKLFEVYLRLQKPLSPDKLTITKAEVEKIIRAIDTDGMYVADYAQDDIGYPGKAWHNKAVRSAVNAIYDSSDNNADIVAEIYSVFGQGDALAKITEATGYDGFVKGDVFVVFNPNQIKSATDNIGTFDINNPDIRYSVSDFSEEKQRNIMDILSPFVGDAVVRDREEYGNYLRERGVKDVSDDEAFHFALEIVRRKNLQAQIARRAKRDNWLYDNILEYKWAVDFAGASMFQIRLSPRFKDKELSGTFWLGKKDKGTPIINLDELARSVADEIGADDLDVEQKLFDFYNGLTWVELRKEYTQFRKDSIAADREADREAREEFMQQERYRIEDEVTQILSAGQPVVNQDWINDNRAVYKELYSKVFPGKDVPYKPSAADIDALNMALVQESGNADTYAQAYKDAREQAWQEYNRQLVSFREKVLNSMTDAVKLQREALDFADRNLAPENRQEFTRKIVRLLEYSPAPSKQYPEGRRRAEFDKIIEGMTRRAADVRKEDYINKIAKRLQQLGERTDSSRKVRGLRDIESQKTLNRIIDISRYDISTLNMAINENQQKIEELIASGQDTSLLEYDIALLNRYGTLWLKSADEVRNALEQLEILAKTGKDNLLAQINQRAADDERDRYELWKAINGGIRYNTEEVKEMADKRNKSALTKKIVSKTFWESLSLDGMLEAMALFSKEDNVVNRFRKMAHKAKLDKDVINSKNADDCQNFLKKLLKTNSSFVVADTIGKWRDIKNETGVFRFVPDQNEKQFDYDQITVDQARTMLALYDAGRNNLPDYEAEAIRQQLSEIDRKIKYDVPAEFRDGATDRIIKLIEQENAGRDKEPVVVIPKPTFKGDQKQMKLNQMQALYIQLMWEQKDIRYKMHYNGITDETMQQIDKFLLPQVKEFGYWMRNQLEKDRKNIEKVYKEMYFAQFPKEENYFPAVYTATESSVKSRKVDIAEAGSAAGAIAYTPGALKVRVYHLKELRPEADALTVFQNHRLVMNHFVTHAAPARKLRSILLNTDVKNAITAEHGPEAYAELQNALQDFINGGNVDVDVNGFLAKLYSNAVRSKMAFNMISGLKQTMGAISYLQEIPPAALAKGMAYAATHPKEVWQTLGDTDYFKMRWNSGSNADLRLLLDAAGKDATKAAVFFDKIDNIGTLPLRFGDAASVLFGGFAVYKYHFDNLVKHGADEKTARKEALLKWEMATERTQQSSAPFLLNKWQRGGAEKRIFTTFTSNQILLWNNNASAIYKSLNKGKASPLKKAGMGIMALLLSSAAMTAFDQYKEHFNDDEYQWWDLLFNAMCDAVTGFGPLGRFAAEAIQYFKPDGFAPSNFWSSDITLGYKAIERQLTDHYAELSDRDYADAVRILQAAGYIMKPAAQAGAAAREARKIFRIFED